MELGKQPVRVKVGGKLRFNSLEPKLQNAIKERLASKDPVANRGLAGELPGIKIDGKVVTKDNIHEFEKKSEQKSESKSKKYSKKDLEKIAEEDGIEGLRDIGDKLGIKFRSFEEAFREILAAQKK